MTEEAEKILSVYEREEFDEYGAYPVSWVVNKEDALKAMEEYYNSRQQEIESLKAELAESKEYFNDYIDACNERDKLQAELDKTLVHLELDEKYMISLTAELSKLKAEIEHLRNEIKENNRYDKPSTLKNR
jgi:chromosome segregation ATPase